jgi:hypothetical protein
MDRKTKRYASLKGAEKRVLFMGPEPWLALGEDPDDRHCCSGHECGCQGQTWREFLLGQRDTKGWGEDDCGMPPLEYVRIERRPLSEWQQFSIADRTTGE